MSLDQFIKDWYARNTVSAVLATMLLIVYVAAMNRDACLPWFIGALVAATISTGFAWPRWLVRRLVVSRSGPDRAQEGETVEFLVTVTNRGFWPRFLIELSDQLPFVNTNQPLRGGTLLGVIPHIPGKETVTFPVPVLCEQRGLHTIGPVSLASSFPLGLIEARRVSEDHVRTITVYPSVFPITQLPLDGSPREINRGDYRLTSISGSTEFASLREYRRGDSPKHIHWPTTARMNQLMVREFEPVASASLCIIPDLALPSNIGKGRESTFEYAIRIAASVACFCRDQDITTQLIARGKEDLSVGAGCGLHHFHEQMDRLAIANSNGQSFYAEVLRQAIERRLAGDTIVVFLSESTRRLSQTLAVLAEARAKRIHILAFVFDQATFMITPTPSHIIPDPVSTIGCLCDLGATSVIVCKGNDLSRLFDL